MPARVDRYQPAAPSTVVHPPWSRSATIYQINTRQFTREGTFRAAEEHLERVRALGVDILWLMPVHEIGRLNRKGPLGSPYAVRDYYSIDPDLGDLGDLRRFVDRAHGLGMHVILDWVANHSAPDNVLIAEHPDWYVRDASGALTPTPWWDWDDVADLDYRQPGLRKYMTDALVYWIREADLDGFRCDVAGFVPVDFWANARAELDQVKPVFMLAEWEARDLHDDAFDMTYGWSWNEALHKLAIGTGDLETLRAFYAWDAKAWPSDSIRMMFVSNHDKNSWEGTESEQFGDALEAAIVLSVVTKGMPLIYNGQEAGNAKRLDFFDRDPIEWRDHPMSELYRRLFALKHENPVLWNGDWGAPMIPVGNTLQRQVLSFHRNAGQRAVFAVFNLSPEPAVVGFRGDGHVGSYTDFFAETPVQIETDSRLALEAWGFQVFVR